MSLCGLTINGFFCTNSLATESSSEAVGDVLYLNIFLAISRITSVKRSLDKDSSAGHRCGRGKLVGKLSVMLLQPCNKNSDQMFKRDKLVFVMRP